MIVLTEACSCRFLLRDWNTGKVPFYTRPPPVQGKDARLVASDTKILTKLGEEFDVFRDGDAQVRLEYWFYPCLRGNDFIALFPRYTFCR